VKRKVQFACILLAESKIYNYSTSVFFLQIKLSSIFFVCLLYFVFSGTKALINLSPLKRFCILENEIMLIYVEDCRDSFGGVWIKNLMKLNSPLAENNLSKLVLLCSSLEILFAGGSENRNVIFTER